MKRPIPRWLKFLGGVAALFLVVVLVVLTGLGWYVKRQMLDSGGRLAESMAAYDVRHYDLALGVDPASQFVGGSNTVSVEVVNPLSKFEIHLDDRMEVESVAVDGTDRPFRHRRGLIRVDLAARWNSGEKHEVKIVYGGEPKVALRPPWIDGFVWSETPTGAPWVGVTGQGDGGDNWWPCKDHPSDEPDDGMRIALTVPSGLVGLSNGAFLGETDNGDGTVTSEWRVNYPINNYLVTVNIAPYVPIEIRYRGVDGTLDEPLVFWSVPEYEPHARSTWEQMPRILEVLGRRFGEYPFFEDKFAVAHAPYYGMEHQTLVAYGAMFTDNGFGFDDLLLHEVAHEWWGNKITVSDWADFWIQEGFATYAEAIYVNDTLGEERYLDYMDELRARIANDKPLVAGRDLTSAEAYIGDIYHKGAWVLHSLRWLVGDEAFFEAVYRFANDPEFAYGLVSSDDLAELVDEVSGLDLDWFWSRYLLRADIPTWHVERRPENGDERVEITWGDPTFAMPLELAVGGDLRRVDMKDGRASFVVPVDTVIEVDPYGRVLATPATK